MRETNKAVKLKNVDFVSGGGGNQCPNYGIEELKKLDREGVGALEYSELRHLHAKLCSMGYNQLSPTEVKLLAHAITTTSEN